MSQDSASQQGKPVAPVGAIRSTVTGAEPYTTNEIALDLNVSTRVAERALDQLRDEGVIERKELNDGTNTTTAWFRPTPVLDPDDESAVDDAVADTVANLDVPGASGMMRDWRRDAVRAAVEHLREEGRVTAEGFREAVFPPHSAGYDSAREWWEMVQPRLAQVPYVVPPTEGDAWSFEAQ